MAAASGQAASQHQLGKILPGRAIPSKRTFKDTFGVSGPTIGTAVRQLKAESLIARREDWELFVVGSRDPCLAKNGARIPDNLLSRLVPRLRGVSVLNDRP